MTKIRTALGTNAKGRDGPGRTDYGIVLNIDTFAGFGERHREHTCRHQLQDQDQDQTLSFPAQGPCPALRSLNKRWRNNSDFRPAGTLSKLLVLAYISLFM